MFWTDLVLETFEKTRTARLYFHMQIAAKLSFQLGSSLGCRRRGINRLSEGQWQRYGSSSGKNYGSRHKAEEYRVLVEGTIGEHSTCSSELVPLFSFHQSPHLPGRAPGFCQVTLGELGILLRHFDIRMAQVLARK